MISVILPAYNEAKNIERAVEITGKELKKMNRDFEIVIMEHGATDGTDRIAEKLAEKHKYVRHIHNKKKMGRGMALTKALRKSKGDILLYMDSDISTNPKYIGRLIEEIENGADISTGSRYLKGSIAKRSLKRNISSNIYNFLIRFLFHSKIKDHQCGFKSFKRKPFFKLLNDIEDKDWFWDTEILVKAQRKNLKVTEFPVEWSEGNESKVNIVEDGLKMGLKIIKLFSELKNSRSITYYEVKKNY